VLYKNMMKKNKVYVADVSEIFNVKLFVYVSRDIIIYKKFYSSDQI
jgi:hypothetical protein